MKPEPVREQSPKESGPEPFRLGIAPIVSGLSVKKSLIPLDAIYNPEIDQFKKAEILSDLDPTPLTLLVLKEKSENYEYRLINEERGVSLIHKQGSFTQGKATFKKKRPTDLTSLEFSKASY